MGIFNLEINSKNTSEKYTTNLEINLCISKLNINFYKIEFLLTINLSDIRM